MISRIRRTAKQLFKCDNRELLQSLESVAHVLKTSLILQSTAVTETHKTRIDSLKHISDLEYKVFSQFGDDGIISFLASHVPDSHRNFIEFGVEDYSEANTRLLLERDNWSGLVIDSSATNVAKILSRPDLWRYDLQATHAFVTRDNINNIFTENGMAGPLGLLSIDIDGNDYWIWEAISVVEPLIVVCEYNSIFGADATITVPYDPAFVRSDKHFSHLYAGASLRALSHLAHQRNMRFLGCNRAGNNAYFVHESLDVRLQFPEISTGYVKSRFREARGPAGQLLMKKADECFDLIAEMPVVDVTSGLTLTLKDSMSKT